MIEISIKKKLSAAAGAMQLALDFSLERETLVALYGKSGAGKTSTLRILAGLLAPDAGRIMLDDICWLDTQKRINLRPQKRKVGLVFQDYALFPNMTVQENLLFALEKGQNSEIVKELVEIIELGDLQYRKPKTLSGGQQQRVALARALVQRPQLLLLDEPLSALDYEMRYKLQQYILRVHQEYGLTTILISHDLPEILRMADKVLLLEQGEITQQGIPSDVFASLGDRHDLQLTAEVKEITKQGKTYLIKLQTGNDELRIEVNEIEASNLQVGDKIHLTAQTFQPVIRKIN